MPSIGEPFYVLEQVDSTNVHAMRLADSPEVGHGTVFFARSQTAGKGQRGRRWDAAPDSSILMSIIIDPSASHPECGFPLSMAVALAVSDWLRTYLGPEVLVKWPNDLYWQDRKMGGILIENIRRGPRCRHSIVGIGVNINQHQFDPSLPNPVSLCQATGKHYDPIPLARELCTYIEQRIRQLAYGPADVHLSDYNERLYGKGRVLDFHTAEGSFQGLVEKVDAEGVITILRPEAVPYRFGELSYQSTSGLSGFQGI